MRLLNMAVSNTTSAPNAAQAAWANTARLQDEVKAKLLSASRRRHRRSAALQRGTRQSDFDLD
jgi:hypothetical protein